MECIQCISFTAHQKSSQQTLPHSRTPLPGHLEDPEQADTAQHRDADGRDDLQLHQQHLQDAAAHHKAVKAVKQGHEVDLEAEGVHLHQHLQSEQHQQDLVGTLWGRTKKKKVGRLPPDWTTA